jgi:uncharacterized protein (TIGR00297 family)
MRVGSRRSAAHPFLPLAAAVASLWVASQLSWHAVDWLDAAGALLISAPPAIVAWRKRWLTTGGSAVGFLCAIAIYLGAFLSGIAVLGVALLLTALSTRFGRNRKVMLGIAEHHDRPRGARSVLANCGVGAIGGVLAAFSPAWSGETGAILLVAGVTAGASDTVASEFGKAFGGRPRTFPTFRLAPAGTPGAVSTAGTIAGFVAAMVIAWPAVTLWLLSADRVALIALSCTAAAFVESALATCFEARGMLDNDALNFLNTFAAASLAVWLSGTVFG